MHKDERFFIQGALDLEVKGYILKDGALAEIVHCIHTMAAGQEYVSPQLTTFLLNRSRRASRLAAQKPRLAELTAIEQHVLKLVADPIEIKEIADQLCLSVRTIEHHRARISQKLELEGRPRPAQIRAQTSAIGVLLTAHLRLRFYPMIS